MSKTKYAEKSPVEDLWPEEWILIPVNPGNVNVEVMTTVSPRTSSPSCLGGNCLQPSDMLLYDGSSIHLCMNVYIHHQLSANLLID